jgi:hypothetical protein
MQHLPVIDVPVTFLRKRLGLPLSLVGCSGVGLVLCSVPLAVVVFDPYRWRPSPDGMVLRVPIGEVPFPQRHIALVPAPGGRPAFRIYSLLSEAQAQVRTVIEVDYPSGEAREIDPLEATEDLTEPRLDLDGDGVPDEVRIGPELFEKTLEVVSGASGAVLFRDRDRFEYAYKERGFPLGDLDGDGYGELGLVHPREKRTYDCDPGDALFGVHGWVTVISGARLER